MLGGDGYLGWPTALRFSTRGHEVHVLDNLSKRKWELECGVSPLFPIPSLHERVQAWHKVSGKRIHLRIGDITDYSTVEEVLKGFQPHAIIHYGEQPSAPYSMIGHREAVSTQVNNIVGTLNVLWAMRRHAPDCHLIKLGTMGEYGTPNIDIEEGFIEIHHKGRSDRLPYPKQPGSFYHLSKAHDSHNILFACKVWGLRSTDLNQGVVYGVETEETKLDERLATSFHYDEVFGTALNRFCVQAVTGIPLTVYGKGGQKRGFLSIEDTLQCVEITANNPPAPGEYRAFNQFTEVFSVLELAEKVKQAADKLGMPTEIQRLENPRVEKDEHYYNPVNTSLLELGLKPRKLSEVLLDSMLHRMMQYKHRINKDVVLPRVRWK